MCMTRKKKRLRINVYDDKKKRLHGSLEGVGGLKTSEA